jgi:hypothetical protein
MSAPISKLLWLVAAVALWSAADEAIGLGADYSIGRPVGGSSGWPRGMRELVDDTNRVHGFFVNAQDTFFYSGTADDLTTFLRRYSEIQGIEAHRLVLHPGVGKAKSPWDKTNVRPCDWQLMGCPRSWLAIGAASKTTNSVEALQQAAKNTNYVLEVQFWTGGKIALNEVTVPKGIVFSGECFKTFESITNGMTRAEVEKRLTMDGGLQGVSPVRFLDTNCPGFKVNVEFDFKKDAADQGRAIMGKDDQVIHVSKPYLERPNVD